MPDFQREPLEPRGVTVLERVCQITADQHRVTRELVTAETHFFEDFLDSLDVVQIIMRCEEAFDIDISDAEFAERELHTVGRLAAFIRGKLESQRDGSLDEGAARRLAERRVIDFLVRSLGVEAEQIGPAIQLSRDLGVDGSDAWELVEDFAREFGVDLTGFEFDDHFGPEAAWNPFSLLFPARLTPVTVSDLVDAAVQKRWTKT